MQLMQCFQNDWFRLSSYCSLDKEVLTLICQLSEVMSLFSFPACGTLTCTDWHFISILLWHRMGDEFDRQLGAI